MDGKKCVKTRNAMAFESGYSARRTSNCLVSGFAHLLTKYTWNAHESTINIAWRTTNHLTRRFVLSAAGQQGTHCFGGCARASQGTLAHL